MNIFDNLIIKRIENASFRRSSFVRLDKSESNIKFDFKSVQEYINHHITLENLQIYPETFNLKNSISEYLSLKDNIGVCVRPGIDGLINSLFTLCKLYNLSVCYGSPCFPMYDVYSEIHNLNYIKYSLTDKFTFDYEDIINKFKKVNLLVLVNPSSPDGQMHDKSYIDKIIEYAVTENKILVIDEAYIEFSDESKRYDFISKMNNIIIFRTFSKAWGLAGLRIGYALLNENMLKWFEQTRPMYEIGNIDALLCNYFISNDEIYKKNIQNIKSDREEMYKILDYYSIKYIESQANFININFSDIYRESFKIYALNNRILYKTAEINNINFTRLSIVGNTNVYLQEFLNENK